MKLYTVGFTGIYPVGSCLILLTPNMEAAKQLASETITHTSEFTVTEVDTTEAGVVMYLDGDY